MQYLALDEEDREAILDYIGEMTLYEEAEADGVSFVLTHSGFTGFDPEQPLDEYSPADFLNANPTPGMEYFSDRTVIVGHTPTYLLRGGKAGGKGRYGGAVMGQPQAAHVGFGGKDPRFAAGGMAV